MAEEGLPKERKGKEKKKKKGKEVNINQGESNGDTSPS
jgi:hypothetical protein